MVINLNFIDRILHFLIYTLFKINLDEGKFIALVEFVKFGIVGLSNTVISYVIYLLALVGCNRTGFMVNYDYLFATVISFILSVLWSFYWNKRFVFKLDSDIKTTILALIKTYISYSFTGLFLSSVLAVFWVEILGVSKIISPILNLVISVPVNFILNKFWAFKK